MLEKKIDTEYTVTCVECGNGDDDKLLLIRDAPWVIECCVCGHPNDRAWGRMDDDTFYDMLLDVVM
jgi:hypothetical protein